MVSKLIENFDRSTKPTQTYSKLESLVISSGSSTTGLNGKPFIPWSKTSGITFLIILNDPLISAFNNLLLPILYNPLAILFPVNSGFLSPYLGRASPSKSTGLGCIRFFRNYYFYSFTFRKNSRLNYFLLRSRNFDVTH